MNDKLIVLLVMILVTALAFGLTIWYDKVFKQKFVEVDAKVVSMDSHFARRGRTGGRIEVFQPEFEYEWNGWKRRVTPRAYASFWNYKLKDTIKLLIDPDDVDNFRIYSFDKKMIWWSWSIIMVFLLVGCFR